jgi:DNA-binding transcriptional regulator YiaG
VAEHIGSLDVEERARAKDTQRRELSLLVPIWCSRKIKMHLVTTRRRTRNRTPLSPSKHPRLRRKTKMSIALFAGVLIILGKCVPRPQI